MSTPRRMTLTVMPIVQPIMRAVLFGGEDVGRDIGACVTVWLDAVLVFVGVEDCSEVMDADVIRLEVCNEPKAVLVACDDGAEGTSVEAEDRTGGPRTSEGDDIAACVACVDLTQVVEMGMPFSILKNSG